MRLASCVFAVFALLPGCTPYRQQSEVRTVMEWNSLLYADSLYYLTMEAGYDGALCGNLYLTPRNRNLPVDAVLIDATGAVFLRTKNGHAIGLKIGRTRSVGAPAFRDTVFNPVYAAWNGTSSEAVLCHYHLQVGCVEACLSLDGDSVVNVNYTLAARILFNGRDTVTVAGGNNMSYGKWNGMGTGHGCR